MEPHVPLKVTVKLAWCWYDRNTCVTTGGAWDVGGMRHVSPDTVRVRRNQHLQRGEVSNRILLRSHLFDHGHKTENGVIIARCFGKIWWCFDCGRFVENPSSVG